MPTSSFQGSSEPVSSPIEYSTPYMDTGFIPSRSSSTDDRDFSGALPITCCCRAAFFRLLLIFWFESRAPDLAILLLKFVAVEEDDGDGDGDVTA
nr:hypothetical protein Iba_chr04aCG8640 [Ipomoea batatas]